MKKYNYTLIATCANVKQSDDVFSVSAADDLPEIHEFVEAPDIVEAYQKVISISESLSKVNPNYKWTLKVLENGYFAGVEDKHCYDCDCEDCDD